MTQTNTVPDGFLQDAKGSLVPITKVKPQALMEDELVLRLCALAEVERQRLADLRELAMKEVRAFQDILAEKYGAPKGGAKGNLTLSSFDGRFKIEVQVADRIAFGPELQAAKALIDQCLNRWTQDGNDNIRAIVMDAFRVDKGTEIAVDRILGLRRYNIDDEDWQRAMTAIGDAVRVVSSKSYIRFYRQDDPDGRPEIIPLNIANV